MSFTDVNLKATGWNEFGFYAKLFPCMYIIMTKICYDYKVLFTCLIDVEDVHLVRAFYIILALYIYYKTAIDNFWFGFCSW